MIGCHPTSPYRLYIPSRRVAVFARNVIIIENRFPFRHVFNDTPGRSRDTVDVNEYGNEYKDGNDYHQVDGKHYVNDTRVVSHDGGGDDSLLPLPVSSSDILQSGSGILTHYPIDDEDDPDLNWQAEQTAGKSASNSL